MQINGTNVPDEAVVVNGAFNTISSLDIRGGKKQALSIFASHVSVLGSKFHDSCKGGIYIGYWDSQHPKAIDSVLIADNYVFRNSRENTLTSSSTTPAAGCNAFPGTWPAAILATSEGGRLTNVSALRNFVYENLGEGIDFRAVEGGTIENNVTYDNYSVNGIYLDAARGIKVDRNLVYSTGNAYFARYPDGNSGIANANEPNARTTIANNVIINNVVIRCRYGFEFYLYTAGTTGLINYKVLDNTFAESLKSAIHIQSGAMHPGTEITNNSFDLASNATGSIADISQAQSGNIFGKNCWSPNNPQDPSFPRAQAIIGDPMFSGASGNGAASFAIGRQSVCSGTAARLYDVPQDYYGRQRPAADDFGAISELATAPESTIPH